MAGLALLLGPVPAYAAKACESAQPSPPDVNHSQPYEDKLYDPARLGAIATGAGVRVAVIDSGVDPDHPQLKGHVTEGADFLRHDSDGRQDCVGHGTEVASIITARVVDGVPFRGLAPAAKIVPVRISEQEVVGGKEVGVQGTPAEFADAIAWAADPARGNAQVINISLVMTRDNDQVRDAVAAAIAAGVVIVAAAGNDGRAGAPNLTPYPAAYPGVIGVGAIGANGQRADFSQHGDYVDIMAAGQAITVAARESGHTVGEGTSFATPFVAATAALLRQRFPTLTPEQVQRRLIATADPAPGGRHSPEYGYGLLNPYRALTETLAAADQPVRAPAVVHTENPATVALAARRERSTQMSLVAATVGAAVAVLLGFVAAVVRRGRRRGWRPAP